MHAKRTEKKAEKNSKMQAKRTEKKPKKNMCGGSLLNEAQVVEPHLEPFQKPIFMK